MTGPAPRRARPIASSLVLLSLALPLAGCTAAVIGGAAIGGYYVGKDERPAGQIADDAAITAAVKARLIASDEVRALGVNVDTYEAVVILKGKVGSREQRSAAERLARATRGVKGVRNELTVERR